MPIDVDCGVTFPYTLPVDMTLTCTYDEAVGSKIEGCNKATVTTERDVYEAEPVPIVWGDPDEEINKTVTIKDISNLFGELPYLARLRLLNGAKFTY
jgi:hypothetical protein